MDYYEIGRQVRKIRKARGLSQEALAEMIGISTTHMSHIETGNTKLSLPVFIALASALEVSADELLSRRGGRDPQRRSFAHSGRPRFMLDPAGQGHRGYRQIGRRGDEKIYVNIRKYAARFDNRRRISGFIRSFFRWIWPLWYRR